MAVLLFFESIASVSEYSSFRNHVQVRGRRQAKIISIGATFAGVVVFILFMHTGTNYVFCMALVSHSTSALKNRKKNR